MKVLIDIAHPAHAHFFRHPISLLADAGHEVVVTSREKDVSIELLEAFGIRHIALGRAGPGGVFGLLRELIIRDYRLSRTVLAESPDVLTALGGTFAAHTAFFTRRPCVVFYDTEFARLQNAITYPFVNRLVVPACYYGKVPEHKTTRYRGYHELSYLHPSRFVPDRNIALANGLDPARRNFLLRIVSWQANHDIGEKHWSEETLIRLVQYLGDLGNVIISAESELPTPIKGAAYRGDPGCLHHLLAYCDLYVGESATVASEAAVLGIPAIYAAISDRGYTNEQENRYGLVKNVKQLTWPPLQQAIDAVLEQPADTWKTRRQKMLNDTIDVAEFVRDSILSAAG